MAIDIIVYPNLSPRIIMIPSETDITVQQLVDACRDWEELTMSLDNAHLMEAAGKEELGGGVAVGITATLQNAKIMFAPQTTPLDDGSGRTCDANDSAGMQLYVDDADFVSAGVEPGDTVFNMTTGASATITEVVDQYTLNHFPLSGGSGVEWTLSDEYKVYEMRLCTITGGNLVAIDSIGDAMEAVIPSVNNYVKATSSSSATLQEISDAQFDDIADSIHNAVIEGTMTHADMLRLILAVSGCKTSGGGTSIIRIRDLLDTKDRVVAAVDTNGNRTGVTLDGS